MNIIGRLYIALAIVMGIAASLPAEAAQSASIPRSYLVWGIGTKSCGYWMENQNDMMGKIALTAWLGGYLTGIDESGYGARTSPPDFEGVITWVANYCAARPLNTIAQAASALRVELRRR